MRWFVVLYFQSLEIQACLDAMVYIANPLEKDSAHITIQGPTMIASENLPLSLIGTEVSVVGVGNFFESGQNTVFLRCGSEFLKKHWSKKDFGFNPHITIYDGPSREFAEKLYSSLNQTRMFFSLEIGAVRTRKSISGQKEMGLWFGIDKDLLRKVADEELTVDVVRTLPDWKRISLINRLASHLTWMVNRPVSVEQDKISATN